MSQVNFEFFLVSFLKMLTNLKYRKKTNKLLHFKKKQYMIKIEKQEEK